MRLLEPAQARDQLAAVRPAAYAATRNHLNGAVTGLSPFLTHGLLGLAEAVEQLGLPMQHKLVQELGWRAYFQHRWRLEGERIFESLHAGPLPDPDYADRVPADVQAGCTGVPVIDQAVQILHATGLLHNHARLWLASYLVHGRKVHWRAGADWLYGHLLDGDLASNHLSWQWVAGTGSHKPYLFNADNVARFAPPAWHCAGSVLDTGYDALERWAQTPQAWPGGPSAGAAPPLLGAPPDGLAQAPAPAAVDGREVWLVHPWQLADPPPGLLPVALLDADFHARWPWSARRWAAVGERLRALVPDPALRWLAPAPQLLDALRAAPRVHGVDNPHLARALAQGLGLSAPRTPWREPARACGSFSAYWKAVR